MALWTQYWADYFDDRKLSDRISVAMDAGLPIHCQRFAPGGFQRRLVMNLILYLDTNGEVPCEAKGERKALDKQIMESNSLRSQQAPIL